MTRIKQMLSAVSITVVLAAGALHAQNVLYVNRGSTSATEDGSIANPFKTIGAAAAATQLQSNTTVIVRGGRGTAEVVYEEANIRPRVSGTATGMIVFRPGYDTLQSGKIVYENVVIKHSGRTSTGSMITTDAQYSSAASSDQTTYLFNLRGISHIWIEGFNFKDYKYARGTIAISGDGNVVVNNRFENVGCEQDGRGGQWDGMGRLPGDVTLFITGSNNVIRNNYFWNIYGEVLNYDGGQDNVIIENTIIGIRSKDGSETCALNGRFEGNRHNLFAFNYHGGSENGRTIWLDVCVGDFTALRNIAHNTSCFIFNESGCERNWVYENISYNRPLNSNRRMQPTSALTDFPALAMVSAYYPAFWATGSTWDARWINNVSYNVKTGLIFERSWRDEARNNIAYEDANNTQPPSGAAPGWDLNGWATDALGLLVKEVSVHGYHADHGYNLRGGGPQVIRSNLWYSTKKDNFVRYMEPTQSAISVANLNAQINGNDIAVAPGFLDLNSTTGVYDFRLSDNSPARGSGDNGVNRGAYAIYEPGIHYDIGYDRGNGLYDVGYNSTVGPMADVHVSFAQLNSPGTGTNYLNGQPGSETNHYDPHRPMLKTGDVVDIELRLNKPATKEMSFKVEPVAGDAWMQGHPKIQAKFPDFRFPKGQTVTFGDGERTKTVSVEILKGNPQHKRDQLLALRIQPVEGSTTLENVGARNTHLIKIRRVEKYSVTIINAGGIVGKSKVWDYIPNKPGFPTPPQGHHPFSITATRPGYDFLGWETGQHEVKVRLANRTSASTTLRDDDLERHVTIQATWATEWNPWPANPEIYTGDRIPEVTGITIPGTLSLTAGESSRLTPALQPEGRNVHDVIWTSTNPRVATVSVSDEGIVTVTALSSGTATIRARAVRNHNRVANCVVTVTGTKTAPTPTMQTEGGYYTIRNVNNSRYMEASGENVAIGGYTPVTKWRLESAGTNYYYIRSAEQYVSVAGPDNDDNVGLTGRNGTNSQQFKFVQVSGDMYLIRTRISNDARCVDAASDGNILQWVSEGNLNQYWIVEFHLDSDSSDVSSVMERDRNVPVVSDKDATVIAPVNTLSAEFTAGPNPVLRSSGAVRFYRLGKRVNNTALTVYDATGNVVRRINIRDNGIGATSDTRRVVGEWDMRDTKGREVAEGTYLVRGTVRFADGKRERVLLIVGVR